MTAAPSTNQNARSNANRTANTDSSIARARELLQSGIKELRLTVPASALEQFLEFAFLIQKWNKVYNLTAIDSLEEIITHHFLDSLAVVPYILSPPAADNHKILDVGTGAGLPGIPLAIALPHSHIYLLESKAKKCAFLHQALIALKITNATVIQSRIENYAPGFYFDAIISRATMAIDALIEKAERMCAKHGQLLVMKGKCPQQEINQLTHRRINLEYKGCIPIAVPYLVGERHLIRFTGNEHG